MTAPSLPLFITNVFNSEQTLGFSSDALKFADLKIQIDRLTSNKERFNTTTPSHIKLLVESTEFLNKKRDSLLSLDCQILAGLAIGLTLQVASFILPLTLVAYGCYVYSLYHLCFRAQAHQSYHAALDILLQCCQWSLGNAHTLEKNRAIDNMIATLAPPTTNEELGKRVSSAIQKDVFALAAEAEHRSMLNTFGRRLDHDQTSAYQSMYGYNKGSLLDASKTFYFFTCQAFSWVKNKTMGSNEEKQDTSLDFNP